MHMVYVVLIILLVVGTAIDIQQRRIPNWLCATILLLGLISNSLMFSGIGLASSLLGLLTGFVSLFALHWLTGLGAGDVKLLAAIGSVVGVKSVLLIFYYSFVVSGLFAIVILMYNGGRGDIFHRYKILFRGFFKAQVNYIKPNLGSTAAFQMPMAPGIAFASAYLLVPKIIAGFGFPLFYNFKL